MTLRSRTNPAEQVLKINQVLVMAVNKSYTAAESKKNSAIKNNLQEK